MNEQATDPVPGAARYYAVPNDDGRAEVVMQSTDGYTSEIQSCKTLEAATNAADRWQKKENKAVLKARSRA